MRNGLLVWNKSRASRRKKSVLVQSQFPNMAHISPFRALRYDPARVVVSKVVTQPYDKITPQRQEEYYAASPENLVRIILGKQLPGDHSGVNTYTRASGFFQEWRSSGVFRQDADPSIYLYTQLFQLPGGTERLERRGFIALGEVEDYSAGVVHRHEQTLSKPKADRLDLLRATQANFELIFMLYSDPAGEIDGLLAPKVQPDIDVQDEYGVQHRVWKVSDPRLVSLVQSKMKDKKLIIADGHHRYETALNYRNERRARDNGESRTAPYDFAVMTFVNMDSPGLVILPTHRVVHSLPSFSTEDLKSAAAKYFHVGEIGNSATAAEATRLLREAGKKGTALLAVTKDEVLLLDNPRASGVEVFGNFSARQQSLDVVQLHKCILEGALGLSEESIRNQQNLSYIRDAAEAIARVQDGSANVAFLMNPARMEQVRDIAFGGEVLPQKSTDFYPKLLSGLTIYAYE